jgi:very-short-patch-repair endonuclease
MGIELKILEWVGLYRPDDYHHRKFDALSSRCNEIESIFWSAGYFELSKLGDLIPQYQADRYRLDFALIGNGFKVAIEIDGHDYHKTKTQRGADYQRQRHLERLGWRFIRFTGSEIYIDVQKCVRDVMAFARGIK